MRTTLPTAREPDVYGHCGPRSRTPILQAMKSLERSFKPLHLRSGPSNLRPKSLANGRIASSPKCRNIASFSTSPISPLTSSPLVLSLSRLRYPSRTTICAFNKLSWGRRRAGGTLNKLDVVLASPSLADKDVLDDTELSGGIVQEIISCRSVCGMVVVRRGN